MELNDMLEQINRELLEINLEIAFMQAEDWQIRLLLTKGMQELDKRK